MSITLGLHGVQDETSWATQYDNVSRAMWHYWSHCMPSCATYYESRAHNTTSRPARDFMNITIGPQIHTVEPHGSHRGTSWTRAVFINTKHCLNKSVFKFLQVTEDQNSDLYKDDISKRLFENYSATIKFTKNHLAK